MLTVITSSLQLKPLLEYIPQSELIEYTPFFDSQVHIRKLPADEFTCMPSTIVLYSEYVREYYMANSVAMVMMMHFTMLCCSLPYYGVHYFLPDNISV